MLDCRTLAWLVLTRVAIPEFVASKEEIRNVKKRVSVRDKEKKR